MTNIAIRMLPESREGLSSKMIKKSPNQCGPHERNVFQDAKDKNNPEVVPFEPPAKR
jgi:hypothetical protein